MLFSEEYDHNNSIDAISVISMLEHISIEDPEIALSILDELEYQRSSIKLIASENYSSLPVLLSMGNWLSDKYGEGCIGNRYYKGCKHCDKIENLCEKRLLELFPGFTYANTQVPSGSDANLLAYCSIISTDIEEIEYKKYFEKKIKLDQIAAEEFEKIRQKSLSCKLLGMELKSGGHLTHGYRRNISSKLFQAFNYTINDDGSIDYEKLMIQANECKPLVIVAGFSACPRNINYAKMRDIADSCGAALMCDIAHISGLVVSNVFKGEYDPRPYADIITSTTHKTLRGPRGGFVVSKDKYGPAIMLGCPIMMGGPMFNSIAAKAIAFKNAQKDDFKQYAEDVLKNAKILADEFINHNVKIFTGGTSNHIVMINTIESFGISGHIAASALEECGIITNSNVFPNDDFKMPSGVRIGSPAITTRNFDESAVKDVVKLIYDILKATRLSDNNSYYLDDGVKSDVIDRVKLLCEKFPLYKDIPNLGKYRSIILKQKES